MRSTRKRKNFLYTYILIAVVILVLVAVGVAALFLLREPGQELVIPRKVQVYRVFVNGTEVGTVTNKENAKEWLWESRKELASQSDELVFLEAEISFESAEILNTEMHSKAEVKTQMLQVLEESVIETMQRSYTVKVNEYMANLASEEEVRLLLEAAIGKYDTEDDFAIELVQDTDREINVLQAQVVENLKDSVTEETEIFTKAGIEEQIELLWESYEPQEEMDFQDYELGIKDMSFPEEIEIVEAYLPKNQMKNLEQAIHELTEEQEQQVIYEVQAGDTLSEIAITVNIPMDDIVAMNDSLESVNSTLQIGQELIITVPEPELSVERHEVNYYEEIYDAEIIYIDVEDWYTYEKEVIQQPSAGFRKVVVEETYVNDELVSREILKEEVVMEAVAKIVKRGTIVPPSYIKPLSGGR